MSRLTGKMMVVAVLMFARWSSAAEMPADHLKTQKDNRPGVESKVAIQSAMEPSSERYALLEALGAIRDHLEGRLVLEDAQIDQHKRVIEKNARSLGGDEKTIRAAFALVDAYDRLHGPLFVNDIKLKRVICSRLNSLV